MGAFSGPETVDGGIVLALDAQNPLSVGNTSLGVWEDVLSSGTRSVGVITCLSIDTASSSFFGAKYTNCTSLSAAWDNRPPSVSDMNEILETFLDCKPYQTGTYNSAGAVFGGFGAVGNICTLRFTGFGVGALIGIGAYFNTTSRQCRLTGDLQNSPVTITSPTGGFANPIVLTSDPADIQFANPGGSGDPMYVYWLGPYTYNTPRSSYGALTNGPVFTQEPKLEPFGGAGAVAFDGSGDHLNITAQSDVAFGTGDFTLECWVYFSSTGTTLSTIMETRSSTSASDGFLIGRFQTAGHENKIELYTASDYRVTADVTVSNNVWVHVAAVRSSSITKLYIDGVAQSTTYSDSNNYSNDDLIIGENVSNTYQLDGYISNFRILKGTALYTSNFTPKRQPLLPESAPNTVLLTCQKGTIRDRSPSAHAITVNGNAKSISGASYFEFDGTDDYIDLGDTFDDIIAGADKKFSMEIWINPDTVSGTQRLISKNGDSNFSENNREFSLLLINDEVACGANFNPSTAQSRQYTTSSANLTAGSWHHIVLVYDGSIDAAGRFTFYVNGQNEAATETYSNGSWGDIQDTAARFAIGAMVGANVANSPLNPYNGKVSNAKVYSRLLTAAEVKQNYRNTKGRYGL